MASKSDNAALGILGLLMALGGGAAVVLVLLRRSAPEAPQLPAPSNAPAMPPAPPPARPRVAVVPGDQEALARVLAAEGTDGREKDIEAAARMLASENPRESQQLHTEQVWTQIRAAARGETLFERITAGNGYGPQGKRAPGGKKDRPVASQEPATDGFRQLVREVLDGKRPSNLLGARRFFEPDVEDRAFAIAERARAKKQAGEALSPQEQRLLGYRYNADGIRKKWQEKDGHRLVGALGPLEFFT